VPDPNATHLDSGLNQAMCILAQDPHVIFVGQNVEYGGNVSYKHLEGVPPDRRLELPVMEDVQMGFSIGLSLSGYIPVSVYPRMDFLILACNQLVNHLDKLRVMSRGQYTPGVIIRTRVGGTTPLNAGPQHTQDHTEALRLMLRHVAVDRIVSDNQAVDTYVNALRRAIRGHSTVVVEAIDTWDRDRLGDQDDDYDPLYEPDPAASRVAVELALAARETDRQIMEAGE